MLKDIYVPIELVAHGETFDNERIAALKQERLKKVIQRRPRGFRMILQSLGVEVFAADLRAHEPTMDIKNLSVGCRELAGHGLGTRILEEGIAVGRRMNPDLDKLTTSWEHVSVLNTIAKVVGVDNVAARCGRENYGQGYDRPLEALLEDSPQATRVQWIEASLPQVDA